MQKGFTLAETVIIAVVIGILAAIALPSFLGWVNRQRVEQGLTQVQGALKETQSEAIKRSRQCTVTIPEGANPTITGTCLTTGNRMLEGVNVDNRDAAGTLTVRFGFKGTTHDFEDGTMVFAAANNQGPRRCLAVALGIGIMRDGDWNPQSATCTSRE